MRLLSPKWRIFLLLGLVLLAACASPLIPTEDEEEEADPAQVAIGERLFLETRFAEFFFRSGNPIHSPLAAGDPVMALTESIGTEMPGPFAGQSMNCAACHLVDQQLQAPGGGMRTYCDFTRRSPIPEREDGRSATPRNSPPLVNSSIPRSADLFLHFDGEFTSMPDLVKGTLTGRNFGWLPGEETAAISHLARVIREDDGQNVLAQEFGALPYRTLFQGTDSAIPRELILPEEFRLDVAAASDEQVFEAVAKLISAYVDNLIFAQNSLGEFSLTPFDRFLKINSLPRGPNPGETGLDYSRRLRTALEKLQEIRFVEPGSINFQFHDQEFVFGPEELVGMKIFFREPDALPLSNETIAAGKIGNCIACHHGANFSDFSFHNTGVTQSEYDEIHGPGSFQALFIPGFAERNADPEAWLPASSHFPGGSGVFLDAAALDKPGHTDLGMWNVFGNPALPKPQAALRELLCRRVSDPAASCSVEALLPLALALFKTPGLRDLGHSQPYMHNGAFDTLESVILHYIRFSDHARSGRMRNTPSEFEGMALRMEDMPLLVKFLQSLNEDYE
ncbi:MAG TPA: hypothetical protein DF383_12960 [Deltaproteobacteria bacterium]|nr:hypothetical protein [Deltaproteobacteria bacterium]